MFSVTSKRYTIRSLLSTIIIVLSFARIQSICDFSLDSSLLHKLLASASDDASTSTTTFQLRLSSGTCTKLEVGNERDLLLTALPQSGTASAEQTLILGPFQKTDVDILQIRGSLGSELDMGFAVCHTFLSEGMDTLHACLHANPVLSVQQSTPREAQLECSSHETCSCPDGNKTHMHASKQHCLHGSTH